MEAVLSFFSDLILFTAGLVVVTMWIILLMLAAVEAWDLIVEKFFPKSSATSEDES